MPNITAATVDELTVEVLADEAAMGARAASDAARAIREAVAERGEARVVIATGNSQYAFTDALVTQDVPWDRVTVFHMDEYVGIDDDHPASFQRWIRERIAERVNPRRVEYIGGHGDPEQEAARYEAALREAPLDLVCMGIGENGHLAFNEPYEADFDDDRWARIIALTEASQRQQVGEGHFPDLASVPSSAISLTIPALLSARRVQVCAPEDRKAEAVRAAFTQPVSSACPATILRRTPHAVLYLEPRSARLLGDVVSA
ncbi:glucosamine/galactosamine-6-phosphate isomerase [Beutenbergia cavernae DSM 12333]|uniref:Glucosamine/galactosamine-6-phosphate isomerase n=1 Tax=Beutenbergia cavernae (strain ATCC BAA-8 / DSM 12333 / CCUG 43141 / JCM 11478 / NBRC 16432 / NCIMB 13614 / HKI 0122) TaxID=471853 RepID=C5BXW0_BEUC1|nr:glucosamine-6-phosphate deaminase [Beutenbergia cavernae]ACQ78854.1 glucosamine/galactosamine-6-phosphate isomerase [Beutenbergia cavernae DSM 12333]